MLSITEIQLAAKTLPNGKAPGPNNITNEVLKIAVQENPKIFLDCFNKCMEESHFRYSRKVANLVLLPKPSRLLDCPSSY